jgi:hypothetical protein
VQVAVKMVEHSGHVDQVMGSCEVQMVAKMMCCSLMLESVDTAYMNQVVIGQLCAYIVSGLVWQIQFGRKGFLHKLCIRSGISAIPTRMPCFVDNL